ncbi:MAG: metal ABC transporter ATP-binding protein [Symploca sp. SIO2G7]|nr:metal ABC transporter ATP-binding protein [Symploca sp. SIO2G7]
MLEVRDLGVCYRNNWAISDISFSLKLGQLTSLLGPNGAGKSTMVKAMLGLVPIAKGVVMFGSRPLKHQLRRVAYVPQRSQIDWDYPITVWNVVMMGRTVHTGWLRQPNHQSTEIVTDALERVGMLEYRHRQIGHLSGGQQQRVFVARALAQQAELLFFDEPFTGIDKKTEEIIFEVFAELKLQNKTLLVISHDLGETLEHYDQLLLLNKQLIAAGTKQEVLTANNISKAYGQGLNLMVA